MNKLPISYHRMLQIAELYTGLLPQIKHAAAFLSDGSVFQRPEFKRNWFLYYDIQHDPDDIIWWTLVSIDKGQLLQSDYRLFDVQNSENNTGPLPLEIAEHYATIHKQSEQGQSGDPGSGAGENSGQD